MPLNNCTKARCPLQDVVECLIEECPYKTEPLKEIAEVKHGEWIEHEDKLGMIDDLMCSLCGHCTYEDYPNFCSNCGADMR